MNVRKEQGITSGGRISEKKKTKKKGDRRGRGKKVVSQEEQGQAKTTRTVSRRFNEVGGGAKNKEKPKQIFF